MINRQLLEKGYLIVNGFVNPEYCHELYQDLLKEGRTDKTHMCDDFHGSVHNHPNPVAAVEIHHYMTKYMTDLVEESLFPTYSYMRIYNNNSFLIKHTDRPACEISVSIHLSGDSSWPIWIQTPKGNDVSVDLQDGDAMIYLGCVAPHWRDMYFGNDYSQVFFHYVREEGVYSLSLIHI